MRSAAPYTTAVGSPAGTGAAAPPPTTLSTTDMTGVGFELAARAAVEAAEEAGAEAAAAAAAAAEAGAALDAVKEAAKAGSRRAGKPAPKGGEARPHRLRALLQDVNEAAEVAVTTEEEEGVPIARGG